MDKKKMMEERLLKGASPKMVAALNSDTTVMTIREQIHSILYKNEYVPSLICKEVLDDIEKTIMEIVKPLEQENERLAECEEVASSFNAELKEQLAEALKNQSESTLVIEGKCYNADYELGTVFFKMQEERDDARRELANCNELFIHYGYDTGSIAERVDRVCVGVIDNTTEVTHIIEERDKLKGY